MTKLTKFYVSIFALLFANSLYAQFNIPGGASPQSVTIGFNTTSTNFVNPPYVSGVISDPTDPAAILGFKVDILENGNPILATDYTITVTSSKTSVVNVSNVIVTKFNGYANVKIIPVGIGYSDVKLKLTKGTSTSTITIKYAASDASATPAATRFHTGSSDASAAIALDSNYMLIGDDEINSLFVYDRKNSGLPVATYDYQNLLGLTDGTPGNYLEIDLEAGVRSINYPNRTYWISSLGTSGSSNVVKPNINRLFAVNVNGTGSSTSFSTVGYYADIRSQLINWGNTNGFGFTASAASGHDAKTIDGFNVEGMCFGPDNTSLYIGFRSPLLPVSARTKAVIAPILNFETWFNNGSPSGNPSFGSPILLDLGGRAFRDIVRLSNGVYIIIAGNYDNLPLTGAVFKWTGNVADAPVLIPNFVTNTINGEAVVEITENNVMANNKLQIISDNGSYVYYNDGAQAKDLTQNNFKKFRSDIFSTANNVLPVAIEYFTVANKIDYNYLHWKINISDIEKVEVEAAEDNNQFKLIAAFLNTEKEMQCNAKKTSATISYYRLKLHHTNGATEYSQIISTKNHSQNTNLQVYPNPSTASVFTVSIPNNLEEKELFVYDASGKIVQQQKFSSSSVEVKKQFAQAGNYYIKVVTKSGQEFEQILINK